MQNHNLKLPRCSGKRSCGFHGITQGYWLTTQTMIATNTTLTPIRPNATLTLFIFPTSIKNVVVRRIKPYDSSVQRLDTSLACRAARPNTTIGAKTNQMYIFKTKQTALANNGNIIRNQASKDSLANSLLTTSLQENRAAR